MDQMVESNQMPAENQVQDNQRSIRPILIFFPLLTIGIVIGSIIGLQWATQQAITLGYAQPHVQIISPETPSLTRMQNYTFKALGHGRDLTYTWSFSDDNSSETGTIVNHTYASTGSFTITVRATDPAGHQAQDSVSMTVLPTLPIASFTTSISGDTVYLDATGSSSDPNTTLVNYDWDFGDGVTDITYYGSDYHTYASDGTYTVTLTVVDQTGQTSQPYKLTVTASSLY